MKPWLSESYILAIEMAELGFRNKLISHEVDLPKRIIKDIVLCHKNEAEPYSGRIENSLNIIKNKDKIQQAIVFMLIYLEVASDPENTLDTSEVISAYKIYREITAATGDNPPQAAQGVSHPANAIAGNKILSGTDCWILARDYRASQIRVRKCLHCGLLSLSGVKDTIWHRCPYCRGRMKK